MAQLAERAGISRVWLYRYFDNRDAIVQALLGREAHEFLAALFPLVDASRPVVDTVTELFVHSVTTLRSHALLRKILVEEPEVVGQYVVHDIGQLMQVADRIGDRPARPRRRRPCRARCPRPSSASW